jgi:hypothetical protein
MAARRDATSTSVVTARPGEETSMSRERRLCRRPPFLRQSGELILAAALATGFLALGSRPAAGQQTIFNVPSADVLGAGKTYVEEDNLWQPGDPEATFFTVRGVVGLGESLEGGVNVGGFTAAGRSVPTATTALKWQPLHGQTWALTTGVHGLFFLRGAGDGTPAAHAYAHVAWSPSASLRLTAGAWYATSGYAARGVARGALAGFELHLSSRLVAQADWYSGKNGLGYFTPGVAWSFGNWVVYAAYSLKNGDSHSNAALLEAGLNL